MIVQAADVTHSSLNPGLPPIIIEPVNGSLTNQQIQSWRKYTQYINLFDDAEYNKRRENVYEKYQSVPYYKFIRIWDNNQRKRFAQDVNAAFK